MFITEKIQYMKTFINQQAAGGGVTLIFSIYKGFADFFFFFFFFFFQNFELEYNGGFSKND